MSYCRKGDDSDVYVYPSGQGIVCHECPMIGSNLVVTNALNMLTHLHGHMSRGDKVPAAAIERLMRETKTGTPYEVFRSYKRLPPEAQSALDRLDALPNEWRERAQRSSVSADELEQALSALHQALSEWDDL